MNNKNVAIAIVAVLVVAVVGVSVYTLYGSDNDDSNTMMFLIQDEEGVYFWIKGEGDNGYAAFGNACETYEIEHEISMSPYGGSIDSVFGMGIVQTEAPSEDNEFGIYIYWNQYSFVNGSWAINEVGIDQVQTSKVKAMALVYTDSFVEPLVTPSDAKIWNMSTDGTVFTITSPTGMSFKVNGTGTTVMDAFTNATSVYKIPFEASMYGGEPSGIDSLFGIEMKQVVPPTEENPYGEYAWWEQKIPKQDGEGWEASLLGMNLLATSEYGNVLIIYGTGDM